MQKINVIIMACAITASNTLMPMKRSFGDLEHEHNSGYLQLEIESENFIDNISFQTSDIPLFEEHRDAIHHPLPNNASTLIIDTIAQKTGKKSFLCPECGKSFSSQSNLNKHINTIHEGIKKYVCDTCKKAFGTRHKLNEHINAVHKEIRDHTCPICKKPFAQKSYLNKHIRTVHEKLKPLNCKICGKAFAANGNLKKHMTTHTYSRESKKRDIINGFPILDMNLKKTYTINNS